MNLKIKVCGMREPENIREVAQLKPDHMGFIFYQSSPRDVTHLLNPVILTKLSPDIIKTGVFVNADLEVITGIARKYSLDMVQLHGNETPDVCRRIRGTGIPVIKAFGIKTDHSFHICSEYTSCTDYFLFDRLTSDYGGSGHKFDWKALNNYDLDHPFFLSGGISPEDVRNILDIDNPAFYGIDLNSRFEINPGMKNTETLRKFISEIRLNTK